MFLTQRQALDAVNALLHQQAVPLSDGAIAMPVPHNISLPAQQRAAQLRPTGRRCMRRSGPGTARLDGPGHCATGRAESAVNAISGPPPLPGANSR